MPKKARGESKMGEKEKCICSICDRIDETGTGTCDSCYYGMRLDPEEWIKKMGELGIEIERHIGCVPLPGGGFACGNPYRRKKSD